MDEAIVDLERTAQGKSRWASVHELLARAYEQGNDLHKANESQWRLHRIYPTECEDLFWLGLNALLIRRNKDLANYYWSACLLIEPNQHHLHGPRDSAIGKHLPTYNVHFLARRLRAHHCLETRESDKELELSRVIRPDLAAALEAFEK